MDSKGYSHIPKALFDAITFLTKALPERSVSTFLELLFGAMLTQQGFVTEAWLAIKPRRRTSYFKWIQKGRWSWVSLGVQTARLALQDVILGLSRISPCNNPRPLSRKEIPAAFSGMPPSYDPVLTNYSCSTVVVVVVCFSWCMSASIVVVVF